MSIGLFVALAVYLHDRQNLMPAAPVADTTAIPSSAREEPEEPFVLEIGSPAHKVQKRDRDGKIGEKDEEVGNRVQRHKVRPPCQTDAVWHELCRIKQILENRIEITSHVSLH